MLGIDIVEVKRMAQVIDRWGISFIERVFTERERSYCEKKSNRAECYAVRFAAKESLYKAFNHPFGWKAVEIISEKSPRIIVKNNKLEKKLSNYNIELSLSHNKNNGVAVVLLTKDENR